MTWGINVELYLLHKENEEKVDFQKSRHLPAVSIPGENWTDEEVEAVVQKLDAFVKLCKKELKKKSNKNKLVFRTNI